MTKPTEEDLQRVRDIAREHDGYYRLSARLRFNMVAEEDYQYPACRALVDMGEAEWLPRQMGPGIRIIREPRPEPPKPPEMSLERALHILAEVHTDSDDITGYRVHTMPSPGLWAVSQEDYVRAWGALRRHIHLQVDPPESKP